MLSRACHNVLFWQTIVTCSPVFFWNSPIRSIRERERKPFFFRHPATSTHPAGTKSHRGHIRWNVGTHTRPNTSGAYS